jgi:hypothetical protein
MLRTVLIASSAIAVLVAAAVAHGLRTDRWGAPANHQAAADRLAALPLVIGDWEGIELGLDPQQAEMTQATGILVRRYTHKYDQTSGSVMVLCGRPGPISVHPPEACYGGAGYVPGPAKRHSLAEGGELWVADFKKEGPTPETLRIHWGWSDGGNWVAPDSPRTAFFNSKILYKLYVIQPYLSSAEKPTEPEPRWLNAVLPELRKCLVTAP